MNDVDHSVRDKYEFQFKNNKVKEKINLFHIVSFLPEEIRPQLRGIFYSARQDNISSRKCFFLFTIVLPLKIK